MINDLRFKIFYLFICLLSFLFIAQTASATSLSLSVDPPITVINAIPPTTIASPLSIQNKSDKQITLQIQLKPFKSKGENGELEYLKEALEIFKNIQILDGDMPVESIILGPKQQKTLTLSINISQDATALDYYFSVIFISTNSPIIESNSSINEIGVATHVLLSVGPPEIPNAVLEEFSSGIFFEAGPVPFTIRVRNEGDHLIHPTGNITIKNMFGQNIGKIDLLNINILSDSIRAIPSKSSFDFKRPTALWKENFLLGLYAATLNISISDKGPTFIRTTHFLAFPLQGLIITVIIVIATIVFINKVKKYTNKNQM
jgi:hypothetical protein